MFRAGALGIRMISIVEIKNIESKKAEQACGGSSCLLRYSIPLPTPVVSLRFEIEGLLTTNLACKLNI